MSRPGDRRPQRPKVRNFVAKHAKDVAGRAGPHKDKKHDYERHPRNRTGGFDPFTGEPLELDPVEKCWVFGTVVPGRNLNPMPTLPPGMVLHAVWTVIDKERLEDEGLIHNVTAFREDNIHDYMVEGDQIRFYSRVVETGEPVELAFEYETVEANLKRTQDRRARLGRKSP